MCMCCNLSGLSHDLRAGLIWLDCARSTTSLPFGTGEPSSQLSCLLCSFSTESQTILLDHIKCHSVADGDHAYYHAQQMPGAGMHQNQGTCSVGSTNEDAAEVSSIKDLSATTGPSLDVQLAPISSASHRGVASFHLREELYGSLCRNPSTRRGGSGTGDMEVGGASFNSGMKSVQPTPGTSGKSRFSCPLCPYTSHNRTHVTYHIRTHTKERPFRCNVCSRTFSHKHHLDRHAAIHIGQRGHKCKVCPAKPFKSGAELALHMCSHTGKEPLQCKVCSQTFLTESKFMRHKSTHASDKPYKS